MIKEFIPFEQALELKELGFDDEESLMVYIKLEDNQKLFYYPMIEMLKLNQFKNRKSITEDVLCKAPLYQQAFRWFREKHGLYHFIGLDVMNMSSLDAINKFAFKTAIFNSKMDGYDAGNYKSFEEAELACLKKLIQIV